MPDSGGYDGSIRIRTKLDNSGIGAGIADLRTKLEALGRKLATLAPGAGFERMGKELSQIKTKLVAIVNDNTGEALGRKMQEAAAEATRYGKELEALRAKLDNLNNDQSGEHLRREISMAEAETSRYTQKIIELREKLDELKERETTPMGTFTPSEEYTQLEKQLEAYQAKHDAAYNRQVTAAEKLSALESSNAQKKLQVQAQIEAAENRQEAAQNKQKTAEEELAAFTEKRRRAVEELGEAYDRLNAKADASLSGAAQPAEAGAAPVVDNTGSEQTLSIWQRIGAAIKTAAVGVAAFAKRTLGAGDSARKLHGHTNKIDRSMNNAAGATRTFGAMLERTIKRILIFRLVHTVLKAIVERFKALMAVNAELGHSVAQLKGSFLMAFQPLLDVAVPVLTTIFRIASKVFKVIAAVIAALFGRTVEQAAANSAALDQEADSIAGVGSAAKKASKSLANFDEINQLQNPDVGSGGGGGGGSLTGGGTIIPEYDTSGLERVYEWLERIKNSEAFQRLQAVWDRFKEHTLSTLSRLKEATLDWVQNTDFTPLANAFAGMLEKLEPLVELIEDGLYWAYTNVLLPLATWAIETLAPTFLDTLGVAFDALKTTIEALQPFAQKLWDDFLKPLAEWVGDTAIAALEDIKDLLQDYIDMLNGEKTFKEFVEDMDGLQIALVAVAVALGVVTVALGIYKVVTAAAAVVTALLTSPIVIVTVVIAALVAGILLLIKNWDKVKETAAKVWEKIVEIWGKVSSWFKEKVIDPIKNFFVGLRTSVGNIFKSIRESIKSTFRTVADWFKTHVTEPIGKFFSDLWDGIKEGVKAPINAVIGFFEGFVNKFIDGLNWFIKAINKISFTIPDWVPKIGGSSVGFHLAELSYVNIPRLAKGGVIPPNAPFLAMLGDQTHGKNIEAPLDTLVEAFRIAQRESNSRPVQVGLKFEGSLSQLGQVLRPVIEIDGKRVGKSFAST